MEESRREVDGSNRLRSFRSTNPSRVDNNRRLRAPDDDPTHQSLTGTHRHWLSQYVRCSEVNTIGKAYHPATAIKL